MNTHKLKIILLFAGAILFNIIFWQEKVAINAILFDVFILLSVFNLYPAAFTKPAMKWLVLAHLVTIATLIIHNTLLAKLAFTATLLLVVVFTQFFHRSVWYAAASVAGNYLLFVFSFNYSINDRRCIFSYLFIFKYSFPGCGQQYRYCIATFLFTLF